MSVVPAAGRPGPRPGPGARRCLCRRRRDRTLVVPAMRAVLAALAVSLAPVYAATSGSQLGLEDAFDGDDRTACATAARTLFLFVCLQDACPGPPPAPAFLAPGADEPCPCSRICSSASDSATSCATSASSCSRCTAADNDLVDGSISTDAAVESRAPWSLSLKYSLSCAAAAVANCCGVGAAASLCTDLSHETDTDNDECGNVVDCSTVSSGDCIIPPASNSCVLNSYTVS